MVSRQCWKCKAVKPADTYHFKRKGPWLTGICRDCINAGQREWWRKRRIRQIQAAPPIAIPTERECSRCHESKPLSREFFDARKDCMYGLATVCIVCRREKQREQWNNDREYRERRLAAMRIDRRLRAEREGRTFHAVSAGTQPWRPAAGHAAQDEGQPPEPLALWLEEVTAEDERDDVVLAELMKVSPRLLWSLRARERATVAIGNADKMLWGYDKPVRIRPETIEAALFRIRERWESAPGNGSRILGYMDEVERLSHLANLVVERVEDLWPALDA